MAGPICFFIDFVSTYSYFAALDIDDKGLCHGRDVVWSVVSLPHVFKQAGTASPLGQPLQLSHNHQDVIRVAAMQGVPLRRPEGAPDVRFPPSATASLDRRAADKKL